LLAGCVDDLVELCAGAGSGEKDVDIEEVILSPETTIRRNNAADELSICFREFRLGGSYAETRKDHGTSAREAIFLESDLEVGTATHPFWLRSISVGSIRKQRSVSEVPVDGSADVEKRRDSVA